MQISKRSVAERIASYFHHEMTLAELVDWAENALMDGEFDLTEADSLRAALGRLGVSDVRAFGLTWEDCEKLLQLLGYAARVEITAAGSS